MNQVLRPGVPYEAMKEIETANVGRPRRKSKQRKTVVWFLANPFNQIVNVNKDVRAVLARQGLQVVGEGSCPWSKRSLAPASGPCRACRGSVSTWLKLSHQAHSNRSRDARDLIIVIRHLHRLLLPQCRFMLHYRLKCPAIVPYYRMADQVPVSLLLTLSSVCLPSLCPSSGFTRHTRESSSARPTEIPRQGPTQGYVG